MRTRKEIEEKYQLGESPKKTTLEVLLDIRMLLLKMSYWNYRPELYDEITMKALPEKWKNKVESGETELENVPEHIRSNAALIGE